MHLWDGINPRPPFPGHPKDYDRVRLTIQGTLTTAILSNIVSFMRINYNQLLLIIRWFDKPIIADANQTNSNHNLDHIDLSVVLYYHGPLTDWAPWPCRLECCTLLSWTTDRLGTLTMSTWVLYSTIMDHSAVYKQMSLVHSLADLLLTRILLHDKSNQSFCNEDKK